MKTATLRALPAALVLASALFSSSAQAAASCSQDRLVIDGLAVSTTLCPGTATVDGGTQRLPLQAHLASSRASLDKSFILRFPALAPTPRAVEDIDLAPLGIDKTLHLSLRPRHGTVEIDHALLLPGPTVIR